MSCASSRSAAMATARTRPCRSTAACSPSSRPPAVSPGPVSPPGVKQIYTYYKNDLVMRKVTAGAADSSFPMINKIGTQVTFQSSSALLSTQLDTGIQQIFWSDYDRQRHRHTIHQLTNGNADSEHAYRAEDAPAIAFESSATDLPGTGLPGGLVPGGAARRAARQGLADRPARRGARAPRDLPRRRASAR